MLSYNTHILTFVASFLIKFCVYLPKKLKIMSKLFPNHFVDLEKGIIYSNRKHTYTTNTDKKGYVSCFVKDIYGNRYYKVHQIIIAEGLQLPKHLWPVDENGKRYIVDHIIPVKNGGTNAFENLHLIPKSDNSRNPISKKNFSKALKGEKNPFYGKHHTDETKEKISNARKGIQLSDEHKQKISNTLKGRPSPMRKKTYQYSSDWKLIKIWDSTSDAAKEGFSRDSISDCCNGKRKSYDNCFWSYNKIIKTPPTFIE